MASIVKGREQCERLLLHLRHGAFGQDLRAVMLALR
jgi:hypothetical protein